MSPISRGTTFLLTSLAQGYSWQKLQNHSSIHIPRKLCSDIPDRYARIDFSISSSPQKNFGDKNCGTLKSPAREGKNSKPFPVQQRRENWILHTSLVALHLIRAYIRTIPGAVKIADRKIRGVHYSVLDDLRKADLCL